jgi:thiol-disulfide isomerase/thioredoxin
MRAALAGALLALLLAGCSGPAPREVGPLVGNLAPDFTVQPVDGGAAFHLGAHRGQVVLLDLMGSNCEPCRQAMPHLLAVRAAHADDAGFAMVSVDMGALYPGLGARGSEDIRRFQEEFNATWPFAPDSGDAGRGYEPIALPTMVLVDGEGVIRFKAGGKVLQEDAVEREIAAAKGA